MTKEILSQYCDLQEEVKDIRKRIDKREREIKKIEEEGAVMDTVTGGEGGIQHFKITGFPYPEYSKKKTSLYLNKSKLEGAEMELLELMNEVEEYIQSLEDSRMRRIMRLRYIDNKTWIQVALCMGGYVSADSVRMEHNRFLGI